MTGNHHYVDKLLSKKSLNRLIYYMEVNKNRNSDSCQHILEAFPFYEIDNQLWDSDDFRTYLKLQNLIIEENIFYHQKNSKHLKCILKTSLQIVTREFIEDDIMVIITDQLMILFSKIKSYYYLNDILDFYKLVSTLELLLKNKQVDHLIISIIVDYILPKYGDDSYDPIIINLITLLKEKNYSNIIDLFNKANTPHNEDLIRIPSSFILLLASEVTFNAIDEQTGLKLLSCVSTIYYDFKNVGNRLPMDLKNEHINFVLNITKFTDLMCVWFCKYQNDYPINKILAIIINDFMVAQKMKKTDRSKIAAELTKFPSTIADWPWTSNSIFFQICHILCLRSSLVWEASCVLKSIKLALYNTNMLDLDFFKSACLVFSSIMNLNVNKDTIFLGKILLERIPLYRPGTLEFLITFDVNQLSWMLGNGSKSLKKKSLMIWFKSEECTDMYKVIDKTHTQLDLLDIIMESDSPDIVARCQNVLQRTQNEETSLAFGKHILLSDENIFRRIIACKPFVPDDNSLALQLSIHFSNILPTIEDENILSLSIRYCRQLLTTNQDTDVVLPFTNRFCLKYLLKKIKPAQESLAIEILIFLKTLIYLQKKNKIITVERLDLNPPENLYGSEQLINNLVKLLLLIVENKNVAIQLASASVLETYQKLLNNSFKSDASCRIFTLIRILFQKYTWLLKIPTTAFFIEAFCLYNEKSSPFNKLLLDYLTCVKRFCEQDLIFLPQGSIVESFVSRADLPQETIVKMIKLYKQLEKDNN